jgi:FixJ family two-component response regulator
VETSSGSPAALIAIVDDDASVSRALGRVVRSAGYAVRTFPSAQTLLDALPDGRVACLVLDIHLTGMNGFDLQERLIADGSGIPVVFISAHEDTPTRERIERSGAAGYLWKPVDREALLDAIRRASASPPDATGRPEALG